MKEYKFTINGNEYAVAIKSVEGQDMSMEVNGKPYTVTVDKAVKETKAAPKVVRPTSAPSAETASKAGGSTGGTIKSPLPGTIVDVVVKVGDAVTEGQKVITLEAMKMENNIVAEKAGTVTEIKVAKGDSVMEGDTLLVID